MTTPVYKGKYFAWVRGISSLTPVKFDEIFPSDAKKIAWKVLLQPSEEGLSLEKLVQKYPISLAIKEIERGTDS